MKEKGMEKEIAKKKGDIIKYDGLGEGETDMGGESNPKKNQKGLRKTSQGSNKDM